MTYMTYAKTHYKEPRLLVLDLKNRTSYLLESWWVKSELLYDESDQSPTVIIEDPNPYLQDLREKLGKTRCSIYYVDWYVKAVYNQMGLEVDAIVAQIALLVLEKKNIRQYIHALQGKVTSSLAITFTCTDRLDDAMKVADYITNAFARRPKIIATTVGKVEIPRLLAMLAPFCEGVKT